MSTLSALFLVALLAAPHTGNAPATQADALVRDLMTIVHVAERKVWSIDRYEINEIMPDALLSVCTATDRVRGAAAAQLTSKIKALGGPARELHAASLGADPRIDDIVTLERSLALLERAVKESNQDCPFTLKQSEPFFERQRPTGRLFLSSEGGGLVNIRLSESDQRAGGGGSGRFMVGYGLSHDWSVRSGMEFGGAGLLDEELDTEDIEVTFYSAIPLTFRHRSQLWHQDIAVAAVAVGNFWNEAPQFAARLGTLIGFTYTRLGRAQPWGGVKLGVEYAPGYDDFEEAITFRVGLRLGADLYP